MLGKGIGGAVGTALVAVTAAVVAPGAAAHGPVMTPEEALVRVTGQVPGTMAPGSSASIECVSAGRRFEVVYARPQDRASRFGEVLPLLRQAVYNASAMWDHEAISQRPGSRARFRVVCDGGLPRVREVALRTQDRRDTASTVLGDLGRAGLNDGLTKYLVYFDGCVRINVSDPDCFTGGVGTLKEDDRASAENANNFGPSYAVDLAGHRPPSGVVLAHEAGHTMGAVQRTAPNSDDRGHCTDALDLMCPAPFSCDNGVSEPDRIVATVNCVVNAAQTLRCGSRQVDCGNDTYFDARIEPSEYLRHRWNIAASYNGFLDHGLKVLDQRP